MRTLPRPIDLFKELGRFLWDFVYPPCCLHCSKRLGVEEQFFCPECLCDLIPVDPEDRCVGCFCPLYADDGLCRPCMSAQSALQYRALVVPYEGAAQTLIRTYKYGGQTYLADAVGALILAQVLRLDWPSIDVIVPVPITVGHYLKRGFNQTLLIAEFLAKVLAVPLWDGLHRRDEDWAQAGLNRAERLRMRAATLIVRPKQESLDGLNVLCIDDVMTTGTTLHCCAQVLRETYCCTLMGLAFAGPCE